MMPLNDWIVYRRLFKEIRHVWGDPGRSIIFLCLDRKEKEDMFFMELTKVDARRCSVQKLLWNISQNSEELAVLESLF